MEIITEQIVELDFSLSIDEWDNIEISLPFVPRIGETISVEQLLDDKQKAKHKRLLKQNSKMSEAFIIKKINHFFYQNIQYTTIFLDFHEIPKHTPFMLSYQ